MSDTAASTPPAPSNEPHDQPQPDGNATEPKAKVERRDFAEVMQTRFKTAHRTQVFAALIVPLALLLSGTYLTALIQGLTSPGVGAVVTVSAAALLAAAIVTVTVASYWLGPDPNIDWATAGTYERQLTTSLPAHVRRLVTAAQTQILRHHPPAQDAHVFSPAISAQHARICTLHTGRGCTCWRVQIGAAVVPARSHPVLVAGERLLDEPDALAFVIAHEVHHVRRPWLHLRLALNLPATLGWLPLGLAVPARHLLVIAPALWLATMVLRWIDELAADAAAARSTRPGTAHAWWNLYRTSRPTPPRWLRPIQPAVKALAPTHPPVALRAWLAARIQRDGRA